MTSDPEVYSELLNDKGMLKEGLPKDLDELEETLEKLEESAKTQKEEATISGDVSQYKNYKQLEEAVRFQRQRIENEGLYQIPFLIDGERRMVNLYVQQDDSKAAVTDGSHLKAVISYKTKNMGTVKAYLEMKGENLGYRIEAEKAQHNDALKAHAEKLIEGLKSIGYNVQFNEVVESEEASEQSRSGQVKYSDSQFEEII